MNKLYYISVNNVLSKVNFSQLLSLVSKDRQEKINMLNFDIDKKISIYAELLLRVIICSKFEIKNDKIIFEKNEFGKLYLKYYNNFYFNLSHKCNSVVIITSDKPVGVDIEQERIAEIQIAKRFFTKNEVAYITKTENLMYKRFYEIWTKKEAYIKYIGKGLSVPLNSFDVFDKNISKKIQTFEQGNYIISFCSTYLNKSYEVIKLTENQLKKMVLDILIKC